MLLDSIRSMGLLERRYAYYATRSLLLLSALGTVAAGFVLIGDSWLQIAVAAVLAVVLTQVIFLGHDAAHRQVFVSARANEIMAMILASGLSGLSLAWWNTKHARHHQAPNQVGKDPDIEPGVVHFYPAEKPPTGTLGRFLHAHQGWWFFPLLAVEAINLHVQSVAAVLARRDMKHRRTEITLITGRLVLYPAVLFVVLSPARAVTFLLVQMVVTGVYLGSVFAPAHVGMPILGADAKMDFFRRQVLISRNITGNRFTTWFMGGLNLQVEHHLFPNMPRPNLRRAQVVVQEFCVGRRVTYTEKTLGQAWVLIIGHMNRVGAAGRDPYACPVVRQLR